MSAAAGASGGNLARPGRAWGRAAARAALALCCLVLCACGQPAVEIVKNGVAPENPSAPLGQAIGSCPAFKSVEWEQYLDSQGVTRVLATAEYKMDLPEVTACPPTAEGGLIRATRAFLRMRFVVDVKARSFSFTGAEFLVYSPQGFSLGYPAGLTVFETVLRGGSGLSCGMLYAPAP